MLTLSLKWTTGSPCTTVVFGELMVRLMHLRVSDPGFTPLLNYRMVGRCRSIAVESRVVISNWFHRLKLKYDENCF
jgi:hypothetical protein